MQYGVENSQVCSAYSSGTDEVGWAQSAQVIEKGGALSAR